MASPLEKPKGNEKPTTNQPTNQLLEEKMGSFSLVDSVHLKEKMNHLGTGVNDLDVRVKKLENSSPDGKRQKELEQSKQEVCNLKEELSIVLKKLDKITAENQQDQEELKY
ncbi:uncharacterized protein [Littorina saxatilis]|uniref:uncharacterized protein n=1 Tax=Littorina saxatilis TaxID=31220 RepID=UPI0038B682C2